MARATIVGEASLDAEGRLTEVDEGFVALLGAPALMLRGRALEETLQFVRFGVGKPPLDAPWQAEARPLAQRSRWLKLEAQQNGGSVHVRAEDISALRRAEMYRSAAVQLAELVADGLRPDPEQRLSAALHEVLDFDRFRLIRLEPSSQQAVLVLSSRGEESGGLGFGPADRPFPGSDASVALPWDQTIIGAVGAGQRVVIVRELAAIEEPPAEVAALLAEGFHSLVGLPLLIARRVVGALVLERRSRTEFREDEVEVLTDLAPLFAGALDRIRLERAAVDSASVYATVFETAGEGIVLSDLETGRIESVNTRYLELTGYRRRTLLEGMRLQDLDTGVPEDPAARAQMIRAQEGPTTSFHKKKSGRKLPVEVTRRMFTWRGRATELTVVRDVRQRLKAERQIRRLAAAVDAVRLGILLTHADGTVAFANPALEGMLGATPHSLDGRPVSDLRELDVSGPFEGEVAVDTADGRRLPMFISRANFGEPAEASGSVEIWTDLSEQKARDQLLMQADKLASLGQTAASVAHEINNPLAFIIANLQTLIEYASDLRGTFDELRTGLRAGVSGAALRELVDDEALVEILEDIEPLTRESLRGAERVRNIVADLRAYARRRDIMQPCALAEVIHNALTLARNEIRYRAEVVVEVPSDLPRVIGSPGRLEQVLLNLLLNAAQALPSVVSPERPNRIGVRAHVEGDRVICEVWDTGAGMSPEVLGRIFEQFFTTKEAKRGTGLGLFISRKIIENHGGTLTVSSTLGEGSCFRLSIPAEEEELTPHPGSALRRCRVLVIDDEEMVLESLARILGPHHHVDVANCGQVGLLRALSESYDVVLCDLGLDDLPGDELYAELIAARPDLRGRFVIISGGAISPEAATVPDEVHRLVKPIPPERLLSLIERLAPTLTPQRSDSNLRP